MGFPRAPTALYCRNSSTLNLEITPFPHVFALSTIVGYANKTLIGKFTIVAQQFDSMKTADGGLTLGDLIPGGTWSENAYTLVINGADGNKKDIEVEGQNYKAKFVYLTKEGEIQNIIDGDNEMIEEMENESPEAYADEIAELKAEIAMLEKCGSGWYIFDSGTTYFSLGAINLPLAPGDGVLINADSTTTLTIPSAL